MNHQQEKYTMISLGLKQETISELEKHTKTFCAIYQEELSIFLVKLNKEQISNAILWFSLEAWNLLKKESKYYLEYIYSFPRILILPDTYNLDDIKTLLQDGFNSILTSPLKQEQIQKAISQSFEQYHIYQDVFKMTKEILLTRDILNRKNNHIVFLLNFIDSITKLQTPTDILNNFMKNLKNILPLYNLSAIFWQNIQGKNLPDQLFIPAKKESKFWQNWEKILTQAKQKYNIQSVSKYEYHSLQENSKTEQESNSLEPDNIIILPICVGPICIGVIAIALVKDYQLGKDHLEILNASLKHLALSIQNVFNQKTKNKLNPNHGYINQNTPNNSPAIS